MIRNLRRFIITIYLIVLIILLSLQIWSQLTEKDLSVLGYIYWMNLIGWIGIVRVKKLRSVVSLGISLILTIIAATLFALGLKGVSEVIFKILFIILLVGVMQAIFENRPVYESK